MRPCCAPPTGDGSGSRSGLRGSRKMWWASMISSPLFIIVAESTEIFAPMFQVGCATAWTGVTCAIAARSSVRNGPPDAVRITRSTASRRAKSNTWKIALCSESTGSKVPPPNRISSISSGPAQTRHSLLARATMAPRRAAVSVGSSPAAPTIAAMTHSAGRRAAATTASRPASMRRPVPANAFFRAG